MPKEVVDGQALRHLRHRFGVTPQQLGRVVGITAAQIIELEEGGVSQFRDPTHKIRCALKVASHLSGVQPNGLPRANVFHIRKKRRAFGDKPKYVAPPAVPWRPEKFDETPEFYKMLLLILVVSFVLIGIVMPILFGTEPPPKVEKIGMVTRS